jgi:hypothetical protein
MPFQAYTCLGNCRGRVVLCAEDIAAAPSDFCTEFFQRLDQYRRLDGHVQTAGNPCSFERLRRAVLLSQCHQAGHFILGQHDLFSPPVS